MTTATVTITVIYTTQPIIRCTARVAMPEYGIKAGDVFYLSRSSKDNGEYYVTRYNERAMCWFCTCPARKPCKHEKAAGLSARAHRLARVAQKPKKAAPVSQVPLASASEKAPSAVSQAQRATHPIEQASHQPVVSAKQREQATLNYANRGFSLERV